MHWSNIMKHSSVDIIIGEPIYDYTSEKKIDWAYYLEPKKIDPEKVLYFNDHKLILHDIDLDDDNFRVDEYDNFIRVGEFIFMARQDMFKADEAVVGFDPHIAAYHNDYLISLIFKLMIMLSNGNIQLAMETIRNVYDNYVNRELQIGFYREFNSQSKFKVSSMNYIYYIDSEVDVKSLDISYNEKVLRYLVSLIWGLYAKL